MNFDAHGKRLYEITEGMSQEIRSTEDAFYRLFHDVEKMAVPLYSHMAHAIVAFENGETDTCIRRLESLNSQLRDLFKVFYDGLRQPHVSHKVWLGYVQGFLGWGIGSVVDGEFVRYHGLSGNHLLVFHAVDAFLGMEPYLAEETRLRYIPARQRAVSAAFRQHSFRSKLDHSSHQEIKAGFQKIVSSLKVFRAAHRARVIPYLRQPAPERLVMTAEKSLHAGSIDAAIKELDDMLVARFKATT